MAVFVALGVLGLLVLVLALFFDSIFEAVADALGLNASGLFSLPVIAAFISACGFGGMLIMSAADAGAGVATVGSLAAGVVVGGIAARVTKAISDVPTAVTRSSGRLPGLLGTVLTAIPHGGDGEVMVRVAGQEVRYSARSEAAVPVGASVVVVTALSATSLQVRQLPD